MHDRARAWRAIAAGCTRTAASDAGDGKPPGLPLPAHSTSPTPHRGHVRSMAQAHRRSSRCPPLLTSGLLRTGAAPAALLGAASTRRLGAASTPWSTRAARRRPFSTMQSRAWTRARRRGCCKRWGRAPASRGVHASSTRRRGPGRLYQEARARPSLYKEARARPSLPGGAGQAVSIQGGAGQAVSTRRRGPGCAAVRQPQPTPVGGSCCAPQPSSSDCQTRRRPQHRMAGVGGAMGCGRGHARAGAARPACRVPLGVCQHGPQPDPTCVRRCARCTPWTTGTS
jgi:hypothetical protein